MNDSAAAAPNFEIGWRRLSQMPASLHSALLSGFPNSQREAGFGDHHSIPVAHRTEAQMLRNRRAPGYSCLRCSCLLGDLTLHDQSSPRVVTRPVTPDPTCLVQFRVRPAPKGKLVPNEGCAD